MSFQCPWRGSAARSSFTEIPTVVTDDRDFAEVAKMVGRRFHEGSYYSSRLVIEAESATHTRMNGWTLVYDLSTTTKTSRLSVIGTRALTHTVNCACCKWLGAHCGSLWDKRMETKIQRLLMVRGQGSDGKLQ